ncbi:MAG: hypothetical protein KF819_32385 [Labilithrix sp.]|nr:hypothetical protein [Labilithrix sp.]
MGEPPAVPPPAADDASPPAVEGGGGPGDATVGVEAATDAGVDAKITVSGVAYAKGFDVPLPRAGMKLTASGKTQDVAVATDGTFSATSILAPYTIALEHAPTGAGTVLTVFEGLTTATPILESGRYDGSTTFGATVEGTITGIASPLPPNTYVYVSARSTSNGVAAVLRGPGEAPTYAITPAWKGNGTRAVSVHVIAYESTGGYPTSWLGYAAKTMNLSSGGLATDENIALGAVATKTINGSFVPASFDGALGVYLRWSPRATEGDVMTFETPATSPFSLVAPTPAGASIEVVWYKAGLGSATYTAPTMGASYALSIPATPTLTSPAAGATFAAGTVFSWSGPTAGVYELTLRSTTDAPWLIVYTKATSVTVPADFVPSPASSYTWEVRYFPNPATVDQLVGPNGVSIYGAVSGGGRQISIP